MHHQNLPFQRQPAQRFICINESILERWKSGLLPEKYPWSVNWLTSSTSKPFESTDVFHGVSLASGQMRQFCHSVHASTRIESNGNNVSAIGAFRHCFCIWTHQKASAAELGVLLRVVAPNADQAEQAPADLAHDLALHAHAGTRHALQHHAHGCLVSRRRMRHGHLHMGGMAITQTAVHHAALTSLFIAGIHGTTYTVKYGQTIVPLQHNKHERSAAVRDIGQPADGAAGAHGRGRVLPPALRRGMAAARVPAHLLQQTPARAIPSPCPNVQTGHQRAAQGQCEYMTPICAIMVVGALVKVQECERELFEHLAAQTDAPEELRIGSIDLIKYLREQHPDASFTLLLGADTYNDLCTGKWKNGDELQTLVKLLVMDRKGVDAPSQQQENENATSTDRVRFIHIPGLSDLSSTKVRATRDVDELRSFVGADVAEYIVHHRLYSFADE